MKEGLSYIALKNIAKIVKDIESEVNEIIENSNLDKPIISNIIISKRNMGYNKIKAEIKNFKKKTKENK
ncbi:hypothetical protein [Anaerofustis sp.]|uniref:hypothetical protein n=1 Tax=Anaerofustis sp. TaxID=1872517 RepID=UPI0025BF6F9C|nr:hypothetical protein [Anaerofustis sp.]